MSAKPTIPKLKVTALGGVPQVEAFLRNDGTSPLRPGYLILRRKSSDGTVEDLTVVNSTTLAPGETTKLLGTMGSAPAAFEVARYKLSLARYEETAGEIFPMEDVYNAMPKGCLAMLFLGIVTAVASAALAYVTWG